MAQGDKILATRHNTAATSVSAARTKWGLGAISGDATAGNTTKATQLNNLLTWVTEAKNKSGYPNSISMSSVTAGSSVMIDQYDTLISYADAVKNYCRCNGNCRDSCNGCSGSCDKTCNGTTPTSGRKSGY